MYCYNCGQDCKDAKFCSNCGVKLGNGAQVQAEEVFPEPGTVEFEAKRADVKFGTECGIGSINDGGKPEMPSVLQTDQTVVSDNYSPELQPPIGKYADMELGADSVIFRKKVLFQKKTVRIIPYSKIAAVSFVSAKGWNLGYLTVREEHDRRDIPTTWGDATSDDTSTTFGDYCNEDMRKVYRFFACCAERWKEAQEKKRKQEQDVKEPPEPWTDEFENKKAALIRKQIPHCPECLSTHVQALIEAKGYGYSCAYNSRIMCLWCGYEWHPRRKTKFLEHRWK